MIKILQTNIKTKRIFMAGVAVFTLTLLSFVLFPSHSLAATINIAGACTLDDAVSSVNAGSNQSGCSGSGTYGTNDTITIPAGTFPYSSANIIAEEVTIQGAGRGQSIINAGGNNEGLDFRNDGVTIKSATVKDLSIINANSTAVDSAYIYASDFSLSVNNVDIYSENTNYTITGAVIALSSNVNNLTQKIDGVDIHNLNLIQNAINLYLVSGSTSTGNVVRNSTIHDVTAAQGGAIAFGVYDDGGDFTGEAYNNTIQDFVTANGGALLYGAVQTTTGSGDGIVNATFRNNTTNFSAPPTMTVGIISIAIAVSGTTATVNTVLQNNIIVGGACSEYTFSAGGTETNNITSLGGNITSDASCSTHLSEPSDHTGVTESTLASTLGPLQDNGGPTPTRALLAGSPAIDNGITNTLTTDQRGIARPQGSGFDTGAYEFVLAATDTNNDVVASPGTLADTGQNVLLISTVAIVILIGSGFAIRRLRMSS